MRQSTRLEWRPFVAFGLVLVGWALLAASLFLPRGWGDAPASGVAGMGSVTTLRPWVAGALPAGGLLGLLLLVGVGVARLAGRHRTQGLVWLVLLGLLLPPAWAMAFWQRCGEWRVDATATAPDGRTYAFLASECLQGQTLAIGRREDETWLVAADVLLGTTGGDWPRSWVPVIRPGGVEDRDGPQLLVAPSGVLVALRGENRCYMAYDLHSGVFLGRGAVEQLSPFLLLGPESELHQPDVEHLVEWVRGNQGEDSGVPHGEVLAEGLRHPNPQVREVAARLLSMRRGESPEA